MSSWILCGQGALVIVTGVWIAIKTEEVGAGLLVSATGLLVIVFAWNPGFMLTLLSDFLGVFLYLVSLALIGFGAWKVIRTPSVDDAGFSSNNHQHYGDTADSHEGTDDWFNPHDDDDGFSDEHQYNDGTADSQNETADSFDPWPWQVLEIRPGVTQKEIRKAYRAAMRKNHPDTVAYLGRGAVEVAHRKTLEIQRAYDTLRQR